MAAVYTAPRILNAVLYDRPDSGPAGERWSHFTSSRCERRSGCGLAPLSPFRHLKAGGATPGGNCWIKSPRQAFRPQTRCCSPILRRCHPQIRLASGSIRSHILDCRDPINQPITLLKCVGERLTKRNASKLEHPYSESQGLCKCYGWGQGGSPCRDWPE